MSDLNDIFNLSKDSIVTIMTTVKAREIENKNYTKIDSIEYDKNGFLSTYKNIVIEEIDKIITENTIVKYGCGFFIAENHIVTSATNVLSDLGKKSRVPDVPANLKFETEPDTLNNTKTYSLSRIDKIKIKVNNVNGTGKSYFYSGSIVGLSGSLNIAVIKIEEPIKSFSPKLKKHPILLWGDSRSYNIGQPVYLISETATEGTVKISDGIVLNNKCADISARPSYAEVPRFNLTNLESVTSDVISSYDNIGSPLLDKNGRVIGVLIGSFNAITPYSIFVSEYVSCVVVNALLEGPRKSCHLEYINDPLGNYYRYIYGELGIIGYEYYNSHIIESLSNMEINVKYTEQIGYLLTDFSENSSNNENFIRNQEFENIFRDRWDRKTIITNINELYLITHINDKELGVLHHQNFFVSELMFLLPGKKIKICYRLGSEGFSKNYEICLKLTEKLPYNDLSLHGNFD